MERNYPAIKRLGFNEFERQWVIQIVHLKQPLAAPQDDGVHDELIFVDQAQAHKGLRDPEAAAQDDVLAATY